MQIFYVKYAYLIDKRYLNQIYFNLKLFPMTIDQIYCNFIFKIMVIFSIHLQINEFYL